MLKGGSTPAAGSTIGPAASNGFLKQRRPARHLPSPWLFSAITGSGASSAVVGNREDVAKPKHVGEEKVGKAIENQSWEEESTVSLVF